MAAWLTVVGLGEDGPAGLGEAARDAIADARVLVGGARHLALIADRPGQQRLAWPHPFSDAYGLLEGLRGQAVCVLASGDPMLHGIGARLAERLGPEEIRVLPAVSSVSLAAARLGWALDRMTVLSLTTQPPETVLRALAPGMRLLVLSADHTSPARITALLAAHGFGRSLIEVFEHLGGPAERRITGTAFAWEAGSVAADLNLIAIECRLDAGQLPRGWGAGLPDSCFQNDGQLTKRDVRAVTLAHLAPWPGALLWDVGAGCGSIGIEWMRTHPACAALAIESDAGRQALIRANAETLGVPGLRLVAGRAPEALAGLAAPDAIFIGGGLTNPGVAQTCWDSLKPGGRLVANAVTLQSEAFLTEWRTRTGGSLTRLSVAEARPLGSFDGWGMAMPVTILTAVKPGG